MGPRRALRRLAKAPTGRLTNLQLLLALALTFATGVGAVATGSTRGRWIVIAHGVAAMVVILLIPWKSRVSRAGVRLHPYGRWFSLVLAALIVATLVFGLGYATGLLRYAFGEPGLWTHVLLALVLVPLLLWHIVARPVRPRRTDLSRRTVLRAGTLGAVGAGLYLATSTVVDLLALPGSERRFTGSYETGSFRPEAMPSTIWLDDSPPVVDASGAYELGLSDLAELAQTRRVTLDCTSGWFAHQDWTGAPVSRLLRSVGSARSLLVGSATGYWVRIPLRDLDTLPLATHLAGGPLSIGHGYPLRLVVPGRRGYWWVKWVDRIEVQDAPWWWQPLFPIT